MMKTIELPMENLAEIISLQMKRGGSATIKVKGSSMMPMLHHGISTVRLKTPGKSLKKGDVILYRRENGRYVLHRIIAVKSGENYLCCGDNCRETETVLQNQVFGVVCAFTRKGSEHTVEELPYQCYVWMMVHSMPVRGLLIRLRRMAGRCLHRKRSEKGNR